MSSGITLTAATRQNLLSLQGTADLLTSTQNHLSTGKKINSALDDPTSFFTSQSLKGRSGDLGSLLNGISNGVQTIQAANQGITSIQKLVDSAKSTANQALADKSSTQAGTPATSASLSAGVSFQGTAGADAKGTHDYSTGAGTVFTLTDGITNHTTTVTLSAATLKGVVSDLTKVSADDVVTAINNQLSNGGANAAAVTASKTTDGRITFTSNATGSSSQVNLTNTAGNTVDIGYGTATTALAAAGADAKDGSSKAVVAGTSLGAGGTVDLSAGKNASFTLQLGSGPAKTITLDSTTTGAGATTSQAAITTAINAQINADTGLAGKVSAAFVNNQLTFTSATTGADQKITVQAAQGAATTAANSSDVGFGMQSATTTTVAAVSASGTAGGGTGVNSTRTTLAKQFNAILDQITQQAKDSSYNGINLLYRSGTDKAENSLKVTFNELGSSSLTIDGAKLDADGLGLTASTGNFQSDAEINKALTSITTATSQLRAQSSTFGSNLSVVQNRQDFSKNLINILDTGSANLTNADLNEEAANSQALSTRQSIGISALSLANTAQQGILQLLR